jgi:peptidoglycan/LPS O-acetylase OafA/YrhL
LHYCCGAPAAQGRHAAIDGLRGYLAFFVFLHHGCVWYFFLRSDNWSVPPSNLYTHFGQSSVALFFMITAFLFFSKLIEARTRPLDWAYLYASRICRLFPLYFFAMCLLFACVAWLSGGVLRDSPSQLLRGMMQWLTFTIGGAGDLNGVLHTTSIMAGVTWSLPYEWYFYFSLPLLALFVAVLPPLPWLVLAAICIGHFIDGQPDLMLVSSFLGGICAAVLCRLPAFVSFAHRPLASLFVLACLACTVLLFPSAYAPGPLILLGLAFSLIASGSSLFGILTHAASRTLGEFAYGIYLLHGILLFTFFHFVLGLTQARALSVSAYWTLVVALTPVLILCGFLAFICIEKPMMKKTRWLVSVFQAPIRLKSKRRPAKS